jgi:glycosyltransferase involved in cell wall biosynthesis
VDRAEAVRPLRLLRGPGRWRVGPLPRSDRSRIEQGAAGERGGVSISSAATADRTPLPVAPTMWTPSVGTRCGVAQYAALLVGALRGTGRPVAHGAEPDLNDTGVLHLQHEHSLVAPEQVADVARRSRERGVPFVVTEHTVRPQVDAWEGDVTALVAHSAESAALLRRRWPAQRVAVIPHGCPTWFPPRKGRRGRVVGTFGFLEPHKGLARLLDAAAALGDVELLLFGSTRAAWADEWLAGLDLPVSVRRVAEFLDEDEIARRLAAEADVLVFPYEQPRFAAVSGAVRIGLATGVPVLTTPTTWFSDLLDVTLQTDDLAGGIARLLDDTALRDELSGAAREHCHADSWPRTAQRHVELYASLR